MSQMFARFNVWKANLAEIERRNSLPGRTFTLAMNHFGDLTSDEFVANHVGKLTLTNETSTILESMPAVANDVDWRSRGAVTSVKNQGNCGSCWAFSTAAGVEGYGATHGAGLVDLAPQELVDCDTGDNGCNGGLPSNALRYVASNKGLNTWSDYPYKGVKGSCGKKAKHVAPISGVRSCTGENGISSCLNNGPVSVAIEADKTDFQYYRGGVFNSANCGTSIDHAVTAVGMIQYQNQPVWIIKNSWGTTWGDAGYMYMIRGKNMCGISNSYSVQPQ